MNPSDIDRMLKFYKEKDLRVQCRLRGITPAGGLETLRDRVKEHMMQTGDFSMRDENGQPLTDHGSIAGVSTADVRGGSLSNNYTRPEGQNVGNFLSDRNSSRVLAPPGGRTQICFGDADGTIGTHNNNYSRPGGTQNVGNFITDKNSSKVLAPPGGRSQISFG